MGMSGFDRNILLIDAGGFVDFSLKIYKKISANLSEKVKSVFRAPALALA